MRTAYRDHFKAKGLKFTGQRSAILQAFLAKKSHVSAEELYALVRKKDPTIGQATVFRCVKLLVEAGIAQPAGLGGRVIRYEPKSEHHDHLICGDCGAVIEFTNECIEKEQDKIATRYGFTLSDHRMELYGLCAACRSKKDAKRKA